MKNKFLAFAIAAICLLTALTASAANFVTVSGNDGKKVSFALATKPTVTFTEESLVITAGDQTVEYPRTDYRIFTFTDDNQTTAIDKVNGYDGSNVVFSFADGLHGEGLKAGSRVMVFSLNGQMVGSANASANGSVDIPLQGNGVYVVKSAEKSFKFIKK